MTWVRGVNRTHLLGGSTGHGLLISYDGSTLIHPLEKNRIAQRHNALNKGDDSVRKNFSR